MHGKFHKSLPANLNNTHLKKIQHFYQDKIGNNQGSIQFETICPLHKTDKTV